MELCSPYVKSFTLTYIVVGWVDNGAKFKETVLPICFIRNEHKYKLGQKLN